MKNVFGILLFAVGFAAGAASTAMYMKEKYSKIAQEEIDSVKEMFKKEKIENDKPEEPKKNQTDNKKVYTDYVNYVNAYTKEEPLTIEERKDEKPYVIPPDIFGDKEDEGYDMITLSYYADNVLTDDDDQIIEDIENTISFESLGHFGEYEEDCVYVRNNRLKVDYEVLRDSRTYSEVLENKPYIRRE